MKSSILIGTLAALTHAKACIVEGTNISLTDKDKPIECVQAGDIVKTLEGVSEVTAVYDNGIHECIRLDFDDGTFLECTPDHQIRCLDPTGVLCWVEAGKLTEEHQIVALT